MFLVFTSMFVFLFFVSVVLVLRLVCLRYFPIFFICTFLRHISILSLGRPQQLGLGRGGHFERPNSCAAAAHARPARPGGAGAGDGAGAWGRQPRRWRRRRRRAEAAAGAVGGERAPQRRPCPPAAGGGARRPREVCLTERSDGESQSH